MKKFKLNSSITLDDAFENFIISKKAKGIADKTVKSYKAQFSRIRFFLGGNANMADLTKADFENMVTAMRDAELSPNSIKSYLITARAFLHWCNDNGITDIMIPPYKGKQVIKQTYTDDELKKLLAKPNMRKCNFAEYRNWVIVNFLLNCGCRAGTLRNILIEDVDMSNNIVFARHTKTDNPQALPICSQMKVILQEYMAIRKGSPTEFLFCNDTGGQLTENGLRCTIAKYNNKRGVEKTSIHLFRHTFARKYLVDCGGNAFTLQKLLGHSTLDMTKHYCAIYDIDIQKNFDTFSPLAQLNANKKKISITV